MFAGIAFVSTHAIMQVMKHHGYSLTKKQPLVRLLVVMVINLANALRF